ncbi:flagellin N-terminal helical domain-containing protein [Ureibacillus manganicus]|uniref:Flagellin n=1 Tax=Ureibacillus manganicus DSM 26584 TaxID=1384049 RepID=A0A0A3J0M8_9BACL|nr:flagellin [Ureibacillus manganicus]KGR80612.1 hypothetical protein CD29_01640 [Ureibacillus manganicus DSM 26584]
MRINHNIAALNTYRQLTAGNAGQAKSMEKLSSGLRINRAGDDAAGLAISEKMRSQIRGLDMASRNSQDAISLIQTAEGALNETHSILQRMRELANQAANGTNELEDRQYLQEEMNQLTSEINRIGNTTEFNKKSLLNGNISDKAGVVNLNTTDNPFAAGTTTVSNVSLDNKSSLEAGNYSVVIADTVTQSTANENYASTGISNIDAASTTGLNEGSYKIDVSLTQTKSLDSDSSTIEDTVGSVTVANTASTGTTTVDVQRLDSVTSFVNGGNTGITAVAIADDAGVDGSYSIKSTAVAGSTSAGTANANYISGVQFSDTASVAAGNGFTVEFAEVGTSGVFTAQFKDALGVNIGDAVTLDNNVQTYEVFSGGTATGISFTTVAGVNTAMDGANESGSNTFDVDTKLELFKGATSQGSVTVDATDVTGTATITDANGVDFTLDIGNGNTLITGKTTDFDIQNDINVSVNGGAYNAASLGDTINAATGVQVTLSNNLADYTAGTGNEESSTIVVENADVYTAELQDSNGDAVSGVGTINLASNGSYNFGNGISFTTGADPIAVGTATFDVVDNATTGAELKLGATTIASKTDISADITAGSIDWGNGLTMDIADATNGTATFEVEGGVNDQSLLMQIGANNGQTFAVNINDMRSDALGISSKDNTEAIKNSNGEAIAGAKWTSTTAATNGTSNTTEEYSLDITSSESATAAIEVLDGAIKSVSSERSKLGAFQNRLEHTINNLGTASENLTAAESRVRDVDMAKEMMEQTKNSILSQAAQAMLAQANQQPQGVLQLLR